MQISAVLSPCLSVWGSGGRAGVRLLLRLLHTRHRQREAAAAQAPNAGSERPWPELQEPEGCDVIEDEFEDVWDLEDHWCARRARARVCVCLIALSV